MNAEKPAEKRRNLVKEYIPVNVVVNTTRQDDRVVRQELSSVDLTVALRPGVAAASSIFRNGKRRSAAIRYGGIDERHSFPQDRIAHDGRVHSTVIEPETQVKHKATASARFT